MSSSAIPRPAKVYARDAAGLRDALFDEMEDLRSGASASHEAVAFSNLASRVIETVELELKNKALHLEQRRQRLDILALKRERERQRLLLAAPTPKDEYATIETLPV